MALLVLALYLLLPQTVFAELDQAAPSVIFFDVGTPSNSVAVVDQEILELDDFYNGYRVRGFDVDSILLEQVETYDASRLYSNGEIDSELWLRAYYRVIVKQMKLIHAAQMRYIEEKENQFASDIETLLSLGYLKDGFTDNVKQGYLFEILKTEQTPRRTPHFDRDYKFLALASPVDGSNPRFYFSIDDLGQVRYGDTAYLAEWGPVWDYADFNPPRTRDIQVDS